MKISAHYSQFKWLLSQIPLPEKSYSINEAIAVDYNDKVDALSKEMNEDMSSYKITQDPGRHGMLPHYVTTVLRTKLGSLIGLLEGEYGLEEIKVDKQESAPHVSIINQNTIAITMNQSLSQLIESAPIGKEKDQLSLLKEELNKPEKDWLKIKAILRWALDFSEKLFFQLLPVILKSYGMTS